jgi:hypothetical protein
MRHLEQKHVEDTYEVPHRAREREILQLLARAKPTRKSMLNLKHLHGGNAPYSHSSKTEFAQCAGADSLRGEEGNHCVIICDRINVR